MAACALLQRQMTAGISMVGLKARYPLYPLQMYGA